MGNWMFLLLSFSLVCALSYSSPLVNGNDSEQQASDKEVKELENLRTEIQKTNNAPSAASVVQQNEAAVQPTESPKSDEEIEPQPNSRSAIFRHRGITQAKKNKYWNEKIQQRIQYSPADLATYVLNTGDEEGVAVAVEELVREGMMGRTDAINYLQDVKQILNDMREQRKKINEFRKQLFSNSLQEEPMKREESTTHPAVIASTPEPKEPVLSTTAHLDSEKEDEFKKPTYDGFTFDVIYKLAKEMFTQSILRDDPTAEDTLSGLVTFLESEVGNKRISPAMKEKVLEIVSAALVDSLREYQRLVSENEAQSFDGLYEQHHAGEPLLPKVPMYRKLGVKGPASVLQLSTSNNKPKSS